MSSKKIIKSTKHFFNKNINKSKHLFLKEFIVEYRRVSGLIIDDVWENGYYINIKDKEYIFDVKHKYYDLPKFLEYKRFNIETFLSARALSSLTAQVVGLLMASLTLRVGAYSPHYINKLLI